MKRIWDESILPELAAGWLAAIILAIALLIVSECVQTPAQAESYVAILGGYNFPNDFSNFQGQYYAAHSQFEDPLKLQNGYALSGKLGWSPREYDWLAIELQAIQSWPNQKEQSYVQFSKQGGAPSWSIQSGTLAGTHWKIFSIGPNVLLRHRFDNGFMVYSGVGMPVFLYPTSYGGDQIRPSPGIDFLGGFKANLTDTGRYRWLVEVHRIMAHQTYVEWDQTNQGVVKNGFSGNYTTTTILIGLEYVFDW